MPGPQRTLKRLLHRLAAVALLASTAALAQAEPADRLTMSVPDNGSEGFEQVRAIVEALKARQRPAVRLEPSASHTARTRLLREGKAQLSATSVAGSFFAQEGLFEFGSREWGPQPVRVVLMNVQTQLMGVVTARDAGIATLTELRGKRVAWVSDAPALNHHLTALLAYGALSWGDVSKVEFPSYGAAIEGLVKNRVDAAFVASGSASLAALAASPRGLHYPIVPHADAQAWARLHRLAPYMMPINASAGTELSAKQPVEAVTYPYPVLITLANQRETVVYELTRDLVAAFGQYRDKAPGNAGWEVRQQVLSWAIPFHEGAVRALSEQGVWNARHQAHNEHLIARQRVLRQAWENLRRTPPESDEPLDKAWMRTRAEALRQANLDVFLKDW